MHYSPGECWRLGLAVLMAQGANWPMAASCRRLGLTATGEEARSDEHGVRLMQLEGFLPLLYEQRGIRAGPGHDPEGASRAARYQTRPGAPVQRRGWSHCGGQGTHARPRGSRLWRTQLDAVQTSSSTSCGGSRRGSHGHPWRRLQRDATWRSSRRRQSVEDLSAAGRQPPRMVADFLIGAHALSHTDQLLTHATAASTARTCLT